MERGRGACARGASPLPYPVSLSLSRSLALSRLWGFERWQRAKALPPTPSLLPHTSPLLHAPWYHFSPAGRPLIPYLPPTPLPRSADYLEIEEIHKALHKHVRGSKHARKAPPMPEPIAMPLQVDTKLDLLQFAELARAREGDDLDDEQIKLMFDAFGASANPNLMT